MKFNTLKPLFIIALLFAAAATSAQNGAVYFFRFNISPELTDYLKVDMQSRKWFSEYSEGDIMPEQLIDSIKIKTEKAFSDKLQMPVKMCFHKYKSEIHFESGGADGSLEGLPVNSYKRGKVDCPGNTRYINLGVQIYSGGSSSVTTVATRSKIKPRVLITVKVVDENNIEVWKKKIELKDFAKLRSVKRYYEGYDVTTSEVLSPVDIYAMYLMGLDKLMEE